jgi:hypothetical protein
LKGLSKYPKYVLKILLTRREGIKNRFVEEFDW